MTSQPSESREAHTCRKRIAPGLRLIASYVCRMDKNARGSSSVPTLEWLFEEARKVVEISFATMMSPRDEFEPCLLLATDQGGAYCQLSLPTDEARTLYIQRVLPAIIVESQASACVLAMPGWTETERSRKSKTKGDGEAVMIYGAHADGRELAALAFVEWPPAGPPQLGELQEVESGFGPLAEVICKALFDADPSMPDPDFFEDLPKI